MIGRLIGNYRVIAKIGEGGMGVVYLAEHPEIGRRLVVKVLHPHLVSDPQNRSRFLNEARAAAAIRHPNIVDVIDVGTLSPEGTPYIVMEHLVGEDLAARIRRRGQLAVSEAIDLAYQTASALGAAHAQGIIHRDLKPANLFLIADDARPGHDRIKVLDFGVAKLQRAIAGAVRTQSGMLLGTPTYMSPEQCLGTKEVDQRSDIYSLGVILYEMVCGVPPFVSSGMGELVLMHTSHVPVSPRRHNAAIPEPLERVILRALAKEPDQRFASAAELQRALTAASPSWAGSVAGAPAMTPTQDVHAVGAIPSTGGHAEASDPATPPAQTPHAPGTAPPAQTPHAPGATPQEPVTGGPGATRAMHYSVIAAPAVGDRQATRSSRAGLWGFLAGAALAAVAAVLFVVARSPSAPPAPSAPSTPASTDAGASDARASDARPAEARADDSHPDGGTPAHPVDARPHPRPVDAGASHSADAGAPHPADAAAPHPADAAAPPIDAGSPPADAGLPPVDAGPQPVDAASPPADAGSSPVDAGRPPRDAGPRPIDAGPRPPRPDAGQPAPTPKIAEACARTCRRLRSCGLRPAAACEQSCTSSPKVSACAVAAADDCTAAATCELVGECNGVGPSGKATCNATFACELRCGSDAGCACHCTEQLALQHATAWLKLQRCVVGCRRDAACIQRSCSRFISACQAE